VERSLGAEARGLTMGMPSGIGIIDLMRGIPSDEQTKSYDFMRPLFRDKERLQSFDFPVQYMFKDFPKVSRQEDYIGYTLALLDKYGIEKAHIALSRVFPSSSS